MARETSCSSCKAPIVWLENSSTRRAAPIDAEPAAQGNVFPAIFDPVLETFVAATMASATHYVVLSRRELGATFTRGATLHLNHFVTCPNAARHAKGGKR